MVVKNVAVINLIGKFGSINVITHFQYPKGEYHDSKYSLLHCKNCGAIWRTKANYVEKVLEEQSNDD